MKRLVISQDEKRQTWEHAHTHTHACTVSDALAKLAQVSEM